MMIICGCLLASNEAQAIITNRLRALVADQVVTEIDLRQAINVEYNSEDFAALSEDERTRIERDKLDELIDGLLIAQKAAALDIKVSDEEIEQTIERVMRQNRMSREKLEAALAQQDLDFASYRAKISNDLLKARYVGKEIKSNLVITNEEINAYAAEHKLFSREETVTIAQIFIPRNSAKAVGGKNNPVWREIRKKLDNEENFFTLASEYSEGPAAPKGGRLGTFKRGNLLTEIEAAAYRIPVARASEVIETSLGYHMIMVTNRTGDQDQPSLTPEAEDKIKNQLYSEKLEKAMDNLGQELRREYQVKILP